MKGLFNLAAVGIIVYLTYYVTMIFAHRSEPPPPVPENQKVLAKQAEELRAEGKKLLSSYGWINPAAKSVRIPIERAMELVAAESAQPATAPGRQSGGLRRDHDAGRVRACSGLTDEPQAVQERPRERRPPQPWR